MINQQLWVSVLCNHPRLLCVCEKKGIEGAMTWLKSVPRSRRQGFSRLIHIDAAFTPNSTSPDWPGTYCLMHYWKGPRPSGVLDCIQAMRRVTATSSKCTYSLLNGGTFRGYSIRRNAGSVKKHSSETRCSPRLCENYVWKWFQKCCWWKIK